MLNIQFSKDVPDSTYFTTGDCEPRLKDDTLVVYDGKGSRRGWGAPSVTSTVVFESTDLIAVHIGFHHKHRGSQFWRYFQINGEIKQIEWKHLDDDTRAAVLEAYEKNAPSWAKEPGKLRKDYLSANPKKNLFAAYKVMRVNDDDSLASLYDKSVTYEIGKTKVEQSKPGHSGGWYVYAGEDVKERYLAGEIIDTPKPGKKALVRCECWGNKVYYDSKIAVTYCKPVEIVEVFEVTE